eukprot:GGOE01027738.1.p2 GENE.GGOE01027738.1~~GGOE01027738.1.p2  ORF type:complete len:157 (-),score=1.74 GGOE01027738.1:157-627(-)
MSDPLWPVVSYCPLASYSSAHWILLSLHGCDALAASFPPCLPPPPPPNEGSPVPRCGRGGKMLAVLQAEGWKTHLSHTTTPPRSDGVVLLPLYPVTAVLLGRMEPVGFVGNIGRVPCWCRQGTQTSVLTCLYFSLFSLTPQCNPSWLSDLSKMGVL